MGRPHVLTDDQREQALVMFVRGSSQRKIAEHFGVSQSTIFELLVDERGRVGPRVERTANDVLLELTILREEAWQSYFDSERTLNEWHETETFGDGTGATSERVQRVVRTSKRQRPRDHRWLSVVQGCIDQEIRVRGLTAPITTRHELRWSGVEPDKIQNSMVRLLAQRVMELQQSRAAALGDTVIDDDKRTIAAQGNHQDTGAITTGAVQDAGFSIDRARNGSGD